MQPILSPSKVSVHLSSWDISRDFHFHSNLLIYIAANNWQDYIKSFSIHGWRKILFSWPKRDIIFLLSSWDIAILFDRLHRFELGAIRFPRIFFNSNTWYWDEKKAKLTNFIELAILEFWCPKRTHNTKSTLLPLMQSHRWEQGGRVAERGGAIVTTRGRRSRGELFLRTSFRWFSIIEDDLFVPIALPWLIGIGLIWFYSHWNYFKYVFNEM